MFDLLACKENLSNREGAQLGHLMKNCNTEENYENTFC